ncbi:MAG: hypothetical protein AB1696_27515 [Planctomycetota bacterium]
MLLNKKCSVAAMVLLFVVSSVLADIIITKKGETWEGMVVRESEDEVILDIKGMCQMPIKKADILKWTKDKKSFIELNTGEKYEYFKVVRETPTEIVIKLDGVEQEMTIKKDLIKSQYIGPEAAAKEGEKEEKAEKTPPAAKKPATKSKAAPKTKRRK